MFDANAVCGPIDNSESLAAIWHNYGPRMFCIMGNGPLDEVWGVIVFYLVIYIGIAVTIGGIAHEMSDR